MELAAYPSIVSLPGKSSSKIKAAALREMSKAATDAPLPAFYGDEFVGCLWRDPEDGVAYGLPASCGFYNYNELMVAVRRGRIRTSWLRYNTYGATNTSWYDIWPAQGGTYTGTALTARAFDKTDTGALPIGTDVPSGASAHWSAIRCNTNSVTTLLNVFMLYDRVLTYEAVAISTTTQTFTNTVPAPRYIDAGEFGLRSFCTLQTANGATASNWATLNYKNMGGTTHATPLDTTFKSIRVNETMTPTAPFLGPIGAGSTNFGPFWPLAAGDMGVKTLEDCSMSANNTGTLCLGLAHPFLMWAPVQNGAFYLDQARDILSMDRVKNGACVSMFVFQGNNGGGASNFQVGGFDVVWS